MPDPVDVLVESSRRLWAGEASVFQAYWDWDERTVDLDRQWLARQCHKELFDGVLPRLAGARRLLESGRWTDDADGEELSSLLAEATEEHRHLRLFAEVYEALAPADTGSLTFAELRDRWRWPENDDLTALRARHRRDHGALGDHAVRLTEGGGATLYAEGARRRGRTRADDLIAAACEAVHADEVRHMFEGVDALRTTLTADEWAQLTELTRAQLKQRIVMRNAQFGCPLSADQVRAAQAAG